MTNIRISPKKLADEIGVSTATLWRWRQAGIPHAEFETLPSGHTRYLRDTLQMPGSNQQASKNVDR